MFTVKQDFDLKRKYSTVSAFSGEITSSGLNKLKNNPDVEGIYLDNKMYTMLQESAPLINAPEVWNKQVNGILITGAGQTVCVIDTGIDYNHPSIGNSLCTLNLQIDGTPESYLLESSHPYGDNEDNTWTITKSGYSNIAVHFDRIDTELGWDGIILYDAQDNIVQAFTGSYNDTWSVSVPGNTIKVQLVSDYSYTDWGFKIDKVLDGGFTPIWQNCGDFIGGYDFYNYDYDPLDDVGHGTHVAGIITSDHSTYKGIAPDSKIIAMKVLGANGMGIASDILAGIDECVHYADIYNISVISLSVGSDCDFGTCYNSYCDNSPFTPFIDNAVANNIMVVTASGNNGDLSKISEPACVNKVTPVGSIGDVSGQISLFSNRWSNPMIFAPGDLIYSTQNGGGFVNMEGTSMSTPHVAGVAALMYQYADLKGITITPQEIEDILIETGKEIYDSYTGRYYTRVDALAAINYLEKVSLDIPLNQGWNLISIPLILNDNSVSAVFSGISYSKLFSYGSGWEEPTEIDNTKGYWIKMNNAATLTVEGLPPASTPVNLNIGWNLISHQYLVEKDTSELYNTTTYAYTNLEWQSYNPDKSSNTLTKFTPGYGYWVKTS